MERKTGQFGRQSVFPDQNKVLNRNLDIIARHVSTFLSMISRHMSECGGNSIVSITMCPDLIVLRT